MLVPSPAYRSFLRSCPPTPPYFQPCAEKGCDAPVAWSGAVCTAAARHPQPAPPLQLYASRTGTAENLAALSRHGFRLLAAPAHLGRYRSVEPPFGFALDNGAWTCHQQGTPFDEVGFLRTVEDLHASADWIVLPDIVAGGMASLDFSLSWLDRLRGTLAPLYLAVQDGMTPADLGSLFPHRQIGGLFVGGTTAWKVSSLPLWGDFCRVRGLALHVGRVNSARRIDACRQAGATSADGTSATLYSVTAAPLAAAAGDPAPGSLFAWEPESERVPA